MGCTSTQRTTATLEAATATWGKRACRTITTVADVADSLENEFIQVKGLNPQGVVTTYVVGKGVDPEVTGTTFVPVSFATAASAADVAPAFQNALNGITGKPFNVSINGAELTLTNRFIGEVSGESMGGTAFVYSLESKGARIELGATDGALEFSTEVETFDVQTNQTGGLVLSQIYLGGSASVSGSFIEITKDKFDKLVGEVTGDTVTPAMGTAVTGFGESRLFQSLDLLGGQLILHPIRLPQTDYSGDYVIWNCAPLVNSTNFDGTALQAFEIEFNAYLDARVNNKINLWSRGDWTQEGLDA